MNSLSPVKLTADQSIKYKKLLDQAVKSRENAYAPISRSKVGAAALGARGEVYLGINCELTGQADHAEQVAINQALSSGEKSIEAIAIFVAPEGEVQEEHYRENSSPCGNCRQAMFEFNPELLVIQADGLQKVKAFRLADMLPNAYKRQWPKVQNPPAVQESSDPLIRQALEARSRSFSLRTGYPEGAAVETESGKIYQGIKAELSSFASQATRMAIASAYMHHDHKITRVTLATGTNKPECPKNMSQNALQTIFNSSPKATIVYPDSNAKFIEQSITDFIKQSVAGT
jgi:cytidine deaminase